MRIIELTWIMENWDTLSEVDQKRLEKYNIKEQYKQGELSHSYNTMMKLFKEVLDIYERYNENKGEL